MKLIQTEVDSMLELHELWLQDKDQGVKADFSGKDLSDLDFTHANCTSANFENANCEFTDFSNANCFKANFKNSNLYKASFTRANCELADFRDATCDNAVFSNANLLGANFEKTKKEQKPEGKMKVLEIITLKSGGRITNQITHQEGWDYREVGYHGDTYVRWSDCPKMIGTHFYVRGSSELEDFNYFNGIISYDSVTSFFNSQESPLDLTDSKPHYSKITQEALDDEFGIGEFKIHKDGCISGRSKDVVFHSHNPRPFAVNTPPELGWWLIENYSYTKRKVIYTFKTINEFEGVEMSKHTWTIL